MRTRSGLLAGWLLAVGSLVRQQRAPSRYNRPSLPERYRIADDLQQPLAVVVAVAEAEAFTGQESPHGR